VHEWALAEAIIKYVEAISKEHKAKKVAKLVLRLGVLQSIDKDILKFSLYELAKLKGIVIDELVFEDEEVSLRCRSCGYRWPFNINTLSEDVREALHFIPEVIHSYIKCPRCGSRDFEVVSGRGVTIKEVVLSGGS